MEKTRTTLDQWITLQAVVDFGGFAQAAEILHRTQSSISYTINKLEQTLGVEILALEKRRAVLTSHGEKLLALSRDVTNKAISLEEIAKSLNYLESNKIDIIIDSLYQSDELLKRIGELSRYKKDYNISVNRRSLNKEDIFTIKNYDLLITHHYISSLNPLFLEQDEGVFVTNPEHELQHCLASNILNIMKKTTCITLGMIGNDYINSVQTIYIPSVELAVKLAENSVGYLWLPKKLVKKELKNNALKVLKIENKKVFYKFYIYMNKNPAINGILKNYIMDGFLVK